MAKGKNIKTNKTTETQRTQRMENKQKKWDNRLNNSLCSLPVPLNQSYLTGMPLWLKKAIRHSNCCNKNLSNIKFPI
jgi:hypothetical protein